MYFALTWVTNAGKLVIVPQTNTTSGGDALFLPRLCSVGTQQESSFSTAATTLPSWLPVASKNISRVSLHGSAPLNSGGPAVGAPRAVFRSHFADFGIVISLGLNWNGIRADQVAHPAAALGRRCGAASGSRDRPGEANCHPTAPAARAAGHPAELVSPMPALLIARLPSTGRSVRRPALPSERSEDRCHSAITWLRRASVIPWWAISRVSVATLGES